MNAFRNTIFRIASCVFISILGACGKPSVAEPDPAVAVDVAPVMVKQIRQWDQFNGRVAAIDAVDIRPRVSGYIQQIAYKEGDEVQRGQVLFKIDPRPYQAALDSALARLQRARASVALTTSQDERAQNLFEAKAVSKDDAETRQASKLQSQADLNDAEAAVAMARLNLEFTQVRAPIGGRTSRALLSVGNLVRADETLLTSVVSQQSVYVYFDPDEKRYLAYLSQGRGTLTAKVGLANEDGYPHTGTVSFFDNQVDPSTATIRARAILKNEKNIFTPGLFARVQVASEIETAAILIDDNAVLTDQSRKYVYVSGPDKTALRTEVTLGRMIDGLRIIEHGLKAGDRVIVNGIQRISVAGMAIKPTEVSMIRSRN